jgi:hypothetical protein
MRRAILGFLLALAAAAGASTPTSAQPVHARAVANLGQEGAAQRNILDVRHGRHRGITFGLYGPGFGFYVGPRYYHPIPTTTGIRTITNDTTSAAGSVTAGVGGFVAGTAAGNAGRLLSDTVLAGQRYVSRDVSNLMLGHLRGALPAARAQRALADKV